MVALLGYVSSWTLRVLIAPVGKECGRWKEWRESLSLLSHKPEPKTLKL